MQLPSVQAVMQLRPLQGKPSAYSASNNTSSIMNDQAGVNIGTAPIQVER